jgi:manganese oxidase
VPSPDSTRVPGSPLVLTRGEPTEIIVHNRFEFPLSVHWHGLELRSLYDGVGGWSGHPGTTRPPIPPGDSARVLITPRRAGTFMYHIHGEAGHELSQGAGRGVVHQRPDVARARFIHIDIMIIDGLDSELMARPLR